MGDRAGALDRWRPLHLLSEPRLARWPSSSRSRASAATRRSAPTCAARPSGSRRSSRSRTAASSRRDGHPVVLGEWLGAPGAPTILVYGHYDVQPPGDDVGVGDAAVRAERARRPHLRAAARPTTRARCVVALETARGVRAGGALPLNVRFLFEGEEEIGSPSLPALPRGAPRRARRRPRRLGRRRDVARERAVDRDRREGLVALDLVVTGPATDLHSGRHGGAVQNPNHALAEIVASLHDAGRLGRRRRLLRRRRAALGVDAALARSPFDERRLPRRDRRADAARRARLHHARAALDAADARGERARAAAGAFTVIPREARAHVTCRLVPDQEPGRASSTAIARHVAAAPAGRRACASSRGLVRCRRTRSPPTTPAVRAAHAGAPHASTRSRSRCSCGSAARCPPRCCSSEILGVKTLLFSFSTADEHLHAPNEFFRLSRLDEGIAAWAELWRLLA